MHMPLVMANITADQETISDWTRDNQRLLPTAAEDGPQHQVDSVVDADA
jgi:hypothetical protein